MSKFFGKVGQVAKIGKSLLDNKQTIKAIDELKDEAIIVLKKGADLLTDIREDGRAHTAMSLLGLNNSILDGNKKKVVSLRLDNCVRIKAILPTTTAFTNQIGLSLQRYERFKNMTETELFNTLKAEPIQIGSTKFSLIDHELLRSYSATLNLPTWLGNNHISLMADFYVLPKGKSLSLNSTMSLVNTESNKKIAHFNETSPLLDIKFNQGEDSFVHASLPQVVNHYISMNEENQIILHFVIA